MPKEFFIKSPREIEFRDYKEPKLKSTEIRLKTIMGGISHGTELTRYRGTTPFVSKDFNEEYFLFMKKTRDSQPFYPYFPTGDIISEVVEVGNDVKNFKVGDTVYGFFRQRPTNVVEAVNLSYWGDILKLPAEITPEEGIFISAAVVALVAIQDARVDLGDIICIFGMGSIGLILLQMAKLSGADTVIVVDINNKRLRLARELGAEFTFNSESVDNVSLEIKKLTEKKGVDKAIDCSGTYKGLNEAFRCVVKGGRVVNAGFQQGGGCDLYLGEEFHHNRLELIQSEGVWYNLYRNHPYWNCKRANNTLINLISKKKIKLKEIPISVYDFKEARDVYRKLDEGDENIVKAAFLCSANRKVDIQGKGSYSD